MAITPQPHSNSEVHLLLFGKKTGSLFQAGIVERSDFSKVHYCVGLGVT